MILRPKCLYLLNYSRAYVNNRSYLSGPYEEFYENGHLKISGNYGVIANPIIKQYDTITMVDTNGIETEKYFLRPIGIKSEKIGTWKYYKSSGELERKEGY